MYLSVEAPEVYLSTHFYLLRPHRFLWDQLTRMDEHPHSL